ncbi:MAG: sulfatase-like hydrolase/transferase [Bacteroidia bacterium]|nr:sulfatase-like hydrolase/transferase [Bacteroidia bacterium]
MKKKGSGCLLVTTLASILIPAIGQGQENRPNVLLLITDEHSGKVMTQNGYQYIKTPGIEKLAANGVTFTRSYCTYPVCVASRASIMTGMMPSKSNENLTAYPGIGDVMKKSGYETAYYGKWHVSNSKMKNVADWHGFESYVDERDDSKTEKMTIDFLTQKHDKPFFMVTSFLNPHDCCELARNIAGLNDKYNDGPVEEKMDVKQCPELPANFAIPPDEPEGFYCRRTPDSTDAVNYGKHPVKYWGETQWRQYMYGYDRLLEKVDNHILNVVNALAQQGLLDNTIIFYTADHGDGHASHQWNQKMNFYEEVINVPFIVSWKGHTKAGKIDSETLISSGLDLFPTICKIAGVKYPSSLPGKDLSPSFQKNPNQTPEIRNYVVSELIQNDRTEKSKIVFEGRMVVSKRYKYILFNGGENREQLFDLEKDPGELQPVTNSSEYKKQLLEHRQMLKDWITKTFDGFPLEKIPQ